MQPKHQNYAGKKILGKSFFFGGGGAPTYFLPNGYVSSINELNEVKLTILTLSNSIRDSLLSSLENSSCLLPKLKAQLLKSRSAGSQEDPPSKKYLNFNLTANQTNTLFLARTIIKENSVANYNLSKARCMFYYLKHDLPRFKQLFQQ